MAMAACQAQCLQASKCIPQGSSAPEIRNRPASVSFTRIPVQGRRQRSNLIVRAAEGNGSCCGGSDGKQSSCSGHGAKAAPANLAGVGAEFENMVSRSTMQEFEKEYDSGEMQGTITRDVVADVMMELPELLKSGSSEEKFVDVDAVLREAMDMANEDFVFESEGTMV